MEACLDGFGFRSSLACKRQVTAQQPQTSTKGHHHLWPTSSRLRPADGSVQLARCFQLTHSSATNKQEPKHKHLNKPNIKLVMKSHTLLNVPK
ncbi:hypothetical protein SFRURICE_007950 [Spodoptera frugiperda]|nr:hypothetical protein SFRURICE_007950 [Spodoptera frugiperda]